MVNGYILIETLPGKSEEVCREVAGLEGIRMAHSVTGPWDVIAFAETADIQTCGDLALHRIQRLPGVVKAMTCLAMGA